MNDVELVETRIQRDEKRLASGTGTAKELEQTQHELETLHKRKSELEEVELEIMVRKEEIDNSASTDSRSWGWISGDKFIAQVLLRYKKSAI